MSEEFQFRLSPRWRSRETTFMQWTDDQSARVREFLDNVNLDALAEMTQDIFQQPCVVSQNFARGACAIVFEIALKNGDPIVARLSPPSITPTFRSTSSEYKTKNYAAWLRYLRTHTDIPVPEVYDACAISKNAIRAPYILMQAIVGRNLLDHGTRLAIYPIPDEKRLKLFHNLASLMAQAYRCQFTAIGGLEMCPNTGQFAIVSSQNFDGSPFNSAKDYYHCVANNIEACFHNYRTSTDPEVKAHSIFLPWIAKRMVMELEFGTSGIDRGPFALCHEDWAFHNLILGDDYKINGIIDWEFAMALPLDALPRVPIFMMPPYSAADTSAEAERLVQYRREFNEISRCYIEKEAPNFPQPYLHSNLEDLDLDIRTTRALFLDEDRRTVALESLRWAIFFEYPTDRLGFEEILVRAVFGPKTTLREAFKIMEDDLGEGTAFLQKGDLENGEKDWLWYWENGQVTPHAKGS
ncbi:hypothetical protein GP486_006762 [Trichoglossum hirsutum]|uniref:Aminoglycoside phosphotransferase domain-containing protein n=1 Tax=Trichoglossum hirsutum TaxID=265104 RepID=A0A9P8IGT8_9PEZI|nr:hypothetical protein GP486_006762 [Trichoglossum hirsutum]